MAHLHREDPPHFAFPFRRGLNGHVVVNEQDSDDDVIDCVEVLLRTNIGERLEEPDYGVIDQTFRMGGADVVYLRGVIAEWEERADIRFDQDEMEDIIDRIRLRIQGGEDG